MNTSKSLHGSLYVLGERDFLTGNTGPYVKIGIVKEEKKTELRVNEHQTGNPRKIYEIFTLTAPMVERLETQLHYQFGTNWIHGEWFLLDENFTDRVKAAAEQIIQQQFALIPALDKIEELKKISSNVELVKPNSFHTDLHTIIKEKKMRLMEKQAIQNIIQNQILGMMEGYGGIEGIVNLQSSKGKPNLEKGAIENNHTDIFKEFEETSSKPSNKFDMKGIPSLSKFNDELHQKVKALPKFNFMPDDAKKSLRGRDAALESLHLEYIQSNQINTALDWELEQLTSKLQASIGEFAGIYGVCTWTREMKESKKFNSTEFIKAHPDLANQYTTPARETVSVMVSPKRAYGFHFFKIV